MENCAIQQLNIVQKTMAYVVGSLSLINWPLSCSRMRFDVW